MVGAIGGAAIAFAIGRAFDGTVQPFLLGTAIAASAAFLLVLMTEPKRLFAGPAERIDS